MSLRNLHIGARMGAGFWILAILVIALVAGNVFSSKNREKLIEGLETVNNKGLLVAAMKSALLERAIEMRNVGLLSDAGAMQKGSNQVKVLHKRYGEAGEKLRGLGLTDAEKNILADLAHLDKEIEAPFAEAMSQAFAFNNEGAAKILATVIAPLHQQELVEINKLVDLQQTAAIEILYQTAVAEKNWMYIIFLIGAVALIALVSQSIMNKRRSENLN